MNNASSGAATGAFRGNHKFGDSTLEPSAKLSMVWEGQSTWADSLGTEPPARLSSAGRAMPFEIIMMVIQPALTCRLPFALAILGITLCAVFALIEHRVCGWTNRKQDLAMSWMVFGRQCSDVPARAIETKAPLMK